MLISRDDHLTTQSTASLLVYIASRWSCGRGGSSATAAFDLVASVPLRDRDRPRCTAVLSALARHLQRAGRRRPGPHGRRGRNQASGVAGRVAGGRPGAQIVQRGISCDVVAAAARQRDGEWDARGVDEQVVLRSG